MGFPNWAFKPIRDTVLTPGWGSGGSGGGSGGGGGTGGGGTTIDPNTIKYLGIYCDGYGYDSSGGTGPTRITAFQNWLGTNVDFILDFGGHELDDRGGWANWLGSIEFGLGFYPAGSSVLWTIPTIPKPYQYQHPNVTSGATLQGAANGQYQGYYQQIAQAIVNRQGTGQIIRIGWEFQGDWYPWGRSSELLASLSTSTYIDLYVRSFIKVVEGFRSIDPTYKICWNPNVQNYWDFGQLPLESCYPGDQYVDYVGIDVYSQPSWSETDPTTRFNNNVLNATYGLAWLADFGARHGKRLAVPEWGAGAGKGDEPTYINLMAKWIKENDCAWHCYWNGGDNFYDSRLSHWPNQQAAYLQQFGNLGANYSISMGGSSSSGSTTAPPTGDIPTENAIILTKGTVTGYTLLKNWDFGTSGNIGNYTQLDAEFDPVDCYGTIANGIPGSTANYGTMTVAWPGASRTVSGQPVDPGNRYREFTTNSLKCHVKSLNGDGNAVGPIGGTWDNINDWNGGNGSIYPKFTFNGGGSDLGTSFVWESRFRIVNPIAGQWFAIWIASKDGWGPEIDVVEAFARTDSAAKQEWHSDIVGHTAAEGHGTGYSDIWYGAPGWFIGGQISAGYPQPSDLSAWHTVSFVYWKDNKFQCIMDGVVVQSGSYTWRQGSSTAKKTLNFLYDFSALQRHVDENDTSQNPQFYKIVIPASKLPLTYEIDYGRIYTIQQ